MNRQDSLNLIKKFPDTPGVYFFRRTKGDVSEILYIGKATLLRDRVRSYFSNDIAVTRGPKILKMLEEFDAIDVQKTDSVLEALLLESFLIKKHQPIYNTDEKDDKSFYYVVITKENFPRVLLARGHDILAASLYGKSAESLGYTITESFGPFPHSGQLKEALGLIRKIFPYRDKCIPCKEQKTRNVKSKNKRDNKYDVSYLTKACKPCFNRQLGLCPGVCTGEVTQKEYRENISNIIRFFQGEKKIIIKNLEKQMKGYAQKQEFEKAGSVKKQLFALNHIHDISLIKSDSRVSNLITHNSTYRIEAYDVAHMSGTHVVGVMTVVENGTISKGEYRKFKINPSTGSGQGGNNDIASLKQILNRRLKHNEWRLPNLIVVDGGTAQKNVAERVLAKFGYAIPVVAVTKNDRHKPEKINGDSQYLVHESDILRANNEAHRYAIGFHKKLRGKIV